MGGQIAMDRVMGYVQSCFYYNTIMSSVEYMDLKDGGTVITMA